MIKIGLISDTHHYLDPKVAGYFKDVDEIWHAGDFGTIDVARELQAIAPLTGVYGNIDGADVRAEFPIQHRFTREGMDIWITHIGGNPGRYALPIKQTILDDPPDLFICGHTHLLKIARDPIHPHMIYMNPGAAGKQGFHEYRTIVRFILGRKKIEDIEVIHLGKRSGVLI